MGTLKGMSGLNDSALRLEKRQDTGAYTSSLCLVNKDGARLETQVAGGGLCELHSATPSGTFAPANQEQVVNRMWVDGHTTTIIFTMDPGLINPLVGTGGNAYDSAAHRASGLDFSGTFASTFVIPQHAFAHETFVWTGGVWNGAPGLPGGPPPTLHGVYFSVGDVAAGPTAPYAAGFDRFGDYLKGDPSSPKTSQELKFMDQISTVGGSQVYLNIHIPSGTANPLTKGQANILIKVIKDPRA